MDGYKELYFTLFNHITDVIHTLQMVQVEAEDLFLLQESKQDESADMPLQDDNRLPKP